MGSKWGLNANLYRTKRTCDFPEGGGVGVCIPNLFFPQLICFTSKKPIIFQGFRGGPISSREGGGVQLFPGGSKC